MEKNKIFTDIVKRTGGDIAHIGVVGPAGCGKTTFITKYTQVVGAAAKRVHLVEAAKFAKEHTAVILMTTEQTMAEFEKLLNNVKKHDKPLAAVINSREPLSDATAAVCAQISQKYGIFVHALDAANFVMADIEAIMRGILSSFGVSAFKITMPKWLRVLDGSHEIINEAIEHLKAFTKTVKKIGEHDCAHVFAGSAHFAGMEVTNVDHMTGTVSYNIIPKPELYYKVLSRECGVEISNEQQLVAYIRHVSGAKSEYDKIKDALAMVNETGYGVVVPSRESYVLEEPQIHKTGKSFGVRLHARASSLHIIKVDIDAEVTPAIGTQMQSEEMLKFLQSEYQTNQKAVWDTPIFGKNLDSIIHENISGKTAAMPAEAQKKMRRTLTKIVNNGKGGVICILL